MTEAMDKLDRKHKLRRTELDEAVKERFPGYAALLHNDNPEGLTAAFRAEEARTANLIRFAELDGVEIKLYEATIQLIAERLGLGEEARKQFSD